MLLCVYVGGDNWLTPTQSFDSYKAIFIKHSSEKLMFRENIGTELHHILNQKTLQMLKIRVGCKSISAEVYIPVNCFQIIEKTNMGNLWKFHFSY